MKLFFDLDPLTCSEDEWQDQYYALKGAPYDVDQFRYSPHLFMPESFAQAIRKTLAEKHDPEYVEKWMNRFWKKAVPNDEFYWRATYPTWHHGGPDLSQVNDHED
jgi:hypothetical protein